MTAFSTARREFNELPDGIRDDLIAAGAAVEGYADDTLQAAEAPAQGPPSGNEGEGRPAGDRETNPSDTDGAAEGE